MRPTTQHFLDLMAMEIEDMKEDIETLRRHDAERSERHEISDYVCRENDAVYRNIEAGIECLRHTLAQVNHAEHADVPALVGALRELCHKRAKELGLREGMIRTLHRKMDKVAAFLANK